MKRAATGDLVIAAIAAFAFGCTILFNRAVARDGLPASIALGVRFGIAGALLLAVLAASHRPLLPPPRERFAAVGLGLFLYAVEATFFYFGLARGSAAAVALIFYAYPAVITVGEIALGAQRPNRRTAVALFLAIGGAATVAVGGGRLNITPAGVVFVCVSIVLFSTYVIVSDRVLRMTDSLTAATWTALGASAGVLAIGVVRGEMQRPSAGAFAALVANGTATAIAFTLFFVVLGRIGPTRTAIVMAMEAVSGVVLAAVFLDESVKAIVAVGGVAVLAGAVLAALSAPRDVEHAIADPP